MSMNANLAVMVIMLVLLRGVSPVTSAELGSNYNKRAIGGTEVRPGEFPFLVGISKHGWHICGGSIIDDRHILTAAHCLLGDSGWDNSMLEDTKIYVGCHKRYECRQIQMEKFAIPEKHFSYQHGDIALIRTKEPIQFNRTGGFGAIGPIELQTKRREYKDDELLAAVGWGLESCGSIAHSAVPMKVFIETWSMKRCQSRMADYGWTLNESHICAGKVNRRTDSGDSGGPLVGIRQDGSKELVGVVSWGAGHHCDETWTSVFTRVSSYIEWIGEAKFSMAL